MPTPDEEIQAALGATPQPKPTSPHDEIAAALGTHAQAAPEPWQTRLKPFNLPNGQASQQRDDGLVWVDPSKGATVTGWADPNSILNQGGKLGVYVAPTLNRPAGADQENKVAADRQLAIHLGMKPDQVDKALDAPGYTPGDLAKGLSDPNGFYRKWIAPNDLGITGGLRRGVASIDSLIAQLGGNDRGAALDDAKRLVSQSERNQVAGRAPTDPGKWYQDLPAKGAELIPATALTDGVVPGAGAGATTTQRLATTGIKAATTQYVGGQGTPQERVLPAAVAGVAAPVIQAGVEKAVVPAAKWVGSKVAGLFTKEAPLPEMTDLIQQAGQKGWNSLDDIRIAASNGDQEAMNLERQFVARSAKDSNVRVTLGDVTQDAAQKKTEVALENKPGSMSDFRAGQQQDVNKAARGIQQQLLDKFSKGQYSDIPALKQAAAGGDRYASRVLEAIESAGDNPDAVVPASLQVQLAKGRINASGAYDEVGKATQGLGNVDLETPIGWMKEELAKQAKSLNPDKALVSELESRLAMFQDASKDSSYNGVREAVSGLGRDSERLAQTEPYASKKLAELRQVTRDAMDNWVKANGNDEAITALNKANSIYKNEVVPYKAKQIQAIVNNADPDKAAKAFYTNSSPDQQLRLYNLLDPKGKDAVAYGAIKNGIADATRPGSANISPAQLAGKLEDSIKESGIAFTGEAKWKMDGFINLLRHVERAGQFAENPPTGNRLAIEAGGWLSRTGLAASAPAYLAGGPGAAGVALAPAAANQVYGRLLSSLYTNPKASQFLIRLSSMTPGSTPFTNFVNTQLPRFAGVSAGRAMAPPNP